MPQIPVYTPQVSAEQGLPAPTATMAHFEPVGRVGGEGLRAVGLGLGQLAQAEARRETTDVQATLAEARADWTVRLAEEAAGMDAYDPDYATKFGERVTEDLAKRGDRFASEYAQNVYRNSARIVTADLRQSAGVKQAQIAGDVAQQGFLRTLEAHKTTVYRDPAQFQSVINEATAALADPNGPYATLPAKVREKLATAAAQDVATSAVAGVMDIEPEEALVQLRAGMWDDVIGVEQRRVLENQARGRVEAAERDREHSQVLKDRAERKAQEATFTDLTARFMSENPNDWPTNMEIVRSGVGGDEMMRLQSFREHAVKTGGKWESDPQTARDLSRRLALPPGDPRRTTDVEIDMALTDVSGRGISFDDWRTLKGIANDYRTADGTRLRSLADQAVDTFARMYTRTPNNLMKRGGALADWQFARAVDFEIERARQEGRDPFELFDPRSARNVLSDAFTAPMRRSVPDLMQQGMRVQQGEGIGGGAGAPLTGGGLPPAAPAPNALREAGPGMRPGPNDKIPPQVP